MVRARHTGHTQSIPLNRSVSQSGISRPVPTPAPNEISCSRRHAHIAHISPASPVSYIPHPSSQLNTSLRSFISASISFSCFCTFTPSPTTLFISFFRSTLRSPHQHLRDPHERCAAPSPPSFSSRLPRSSSPRLSPTAVPHTPVPVAPRLAGVTARPTTRAGWRTVCRRWTWRAGILDKEARRRAGTRSVGVRTSERELHQTRSILMDEERRERR